MTVPLVFQSQSMHRLLLQARRFAQASASVLICGECGTGKELFARTVHLESPRSKGPFVAVNCAALPAELLESELFGHEPGAFTGATARRLGRFELAEHGTLFLDEVGELPPAAQPKLLRVLEEKEVQRIGDRHVRQVDVRLVSATNRDLSADIVRGRYRDDLFHRLGVLLLRIPPLRERREDIPPLVQHFVSRFGHEGTQSVLGVTADVMRKLTAFDWPGNVRQLRNVIWRACILADRDRISDVELMDDESSPSAPEPLPRELNLLPLKEIERRVILERLRKFDGNRSRTAETLGVTTRTLRNKLADYRQQRDAA